MKQSYLADISRLPEKPKQAIEDYVAELERQIERVDREKRKWATK